MKHQINRAQISMLQSLHSFILTLCSLQFHIFTVVVCWSGYLHLKPKSPCDFSLHHCYSSAFHANSMMLPMCSVSSDWQDSLEYVCAVKVIFLFFTHLFNSLPAFLTSLVSFSQGLKGNLLTQYCVVPCQCCCPVYWSQNKDFITFPVTW